MRYWILASVLAGAIYGAGQAQTTYSPDMTPYVTQSQLATTQVQTANAVTQGDGSFSGTWPAPFATQPMSYIAGIPSTSNTPIVCSIQFADVNGFTGKCWQMSPTTLPGTTTALLGLVISPISSAAAGQTVRVFGKQ